MFRKIISWLFSRNESFPSETEESLRKRAELVEKVAELEKRNANLLTVVKNQNEIIAEFKALPVEVDAFIGDPSPKDSKERALYVAQVAAFHKDILVPKLHQMISNTHSILERHDNDREIDQALKGVILAFREMLLWGEKMTAEHVAMQQETKEKQANPTT